MLALLPSLNGGHFYALKVQNMAIFKAHTFTNVLGEIDRLTKMRLLFFLTCIELFIRENPGNKKKLLKDINLLYNSINDYVHKLKMNHS